MKRSKYQQDILDFAGDEDSNENGIGVAYAGSGKSTILKGISEEVDDEQSMVICAFNVPIAQELASKIHRANTEIKTNHSLALRSLKMHWRKKCELKDGFDYLDFVINSVVPKVAKDDVKGDVKALVEKAMVFVADDNPDLAVQRVTDLMYRFECHPKDKTMPPEQYVEWALKALVMLREPSDVICFGQMIYVPAFHRWSTGDFRWALVDETQDMNRAQLIVAKNALHQCGRFFAAGDPFQAIYAWNGADTESMDKVQRTFRAKVFKLPISYRAPEAVAELVRRYIPDFVARPGAPQGFVKEVDERFMMDHWKPGDMFLSRKNATLPKACLMALSCGVPAYIRGGKDITRGLFNVIQKSKQHSIANFLRWTKEYEESQVALLMMAKQEKKADELIDTIATLVELSDECRTTEDLKNRMTRLFIDEHPEGKLMCSSVHKAKGLETESEENAVWLDWNTFRDNTDEEKNIAYVAQTRTKGPLYLVRMGDKKKPKKGPV